ncbi:zinc-dependent alcohol dehydrogenase family protein [Nakamurella flavida]|uniref:Zinc-dependent alcohol dehydrogenase family protein n=1 Tax=Nakamurella flavida TaxID=363630 RepID=A0A939C1W9_9ACTN|nr:zinc-dependent alcohol dehydrogenase family protein [Nakamurella flavida]MBM9475441.1 zinc-dependent alcohol dehydrogenase family protein [Nakamurella flavida]MDP9777052.1 D-arabinitol dehydrogenase (NADP+) [Nakamurella flavida]
MKAVLYSGAGDYAVTEVPTPSPAAGEVLVKVTQVGVCGTDQHIHHGEFGAKFPLIPGHEVVGTVAEIGAGVTRVTVGQQVAVNPNIPCRSCSYCLSGRFILCENALALGVNQPGFFAEYACADENLVFSAEGLDPDTAVFTEPAACAMHGLETAQVRPGSTALVLGAGPTGLLLAQLLATGGASSVTVAAPTAFKLDTARALGADNTVQIDRDDAAANIEKLRAASPDGDGYDLVVEATGSPAVGEICVPLTRNGGTVMIYGVTGEADRIAISPYDVFHREITIKGSFAEMTSFGAALAAMRSGRMKTDGIITHRFTLDEYPQALAAVTGDKSAHKIVITV